MHISIPVLLLVLWIHFVADFVLQNDTMAINKSSNNKWLFIHSLIYALPFVIFGFRFACVTLLLHFIVDYYSSRATTTLYLNNKRHWFFVTIGLDQVLHINFLILTVQVFQIKGVFGW